MKRNGIILAVIIVVVVVMLYSGRFLSHRPVNPALTGSADQIKGKAAPGLRINRPQREDREATRITAARLCC